MPLQPRKRSLLTPLALLTTLLTSACSQGSAANAPPAHPEGPIRTPAFVDGAYLNPGFKKRPSDLIRFSFSREPGVWLRDLDTAPGPKPPASVTGDGLRVTVIGHASTLLQMDGINLLTDPVYSLRASPMQWAGPKRFTPPMIAFEDLPRIDAVIISHNHYDHLDLPTLQRLEAAFRPLFIVGERQGALLKAAGLTRVQELNWEGSVALSESYSIHGAPSQHWTARGIGDRNQALWMSYVLESRAGRIYFAGDTGYGRQFVQAQARFGGFRLALLPIGAYKPRWLTDFQHMDPCEALRAHRELRAAESVAIHYGTFELSDDGQTEPIQELARCVQQEAPSPDAAPFRVLPFGQGYDVTPTQ
jgi:L-ascorbate metabolism protein UlaG (beta-lactamase superfamily)